MATVVEWLAAQAREAREQLAKYKFAGMRHNAAWCEAQAAAYEAAHAYAIVRPDASAPPAPTPDAGSDLAKLEARANEVVQRVAEWDDRTSPEDWPEAMLITGEELHRELVAFAQETASPPPGEDLAGQGEPVAWALELADAFERSGKTLFFPEQFPAGYPAGWDAAHRECAKDLRHAAKYPPTAAPAPSRPADREEIDIDALADAIAAADHGYDIRLTSLNEERRVYTLDTRDGAPVLEFADIEDAQEHASRHRSLARAKAAVAFLALRDAPRAGGDGWRPIETAPDDGSGFVAICSNAQSPKPKVCWRQGEAWMTVSGPEKFMPAGPYRWWPTHWRPVADEGGGKQDRTRAALLTSSDILADDWEIVAPPSPNAGDGTRPSAPAGPATPPVAPEDVEWLAREAIRTGDRTLARIATALKVGGA